MAAVLAGPVAEGIVFHVANKCPFPVWPATVPNTGHPVLAGGGFFLPPRKTRRVAAPATWNGRFWARTGCNFTANNSATSACLTGDCEGRLACNGSVGAPPATLVEVSLHADPTKGGSSYDVSLVDGYNLPVSVSAATSGSKQQQCAIAGCAKDVNAVCPPELQVKTSGGGKSSSAQVVACKSACLAFGVDAFCCRGKYATPDACRASVYSRLFKDACPAYYSYAYDTTAATATGCYASEYVITFCPDRWGREEIGRAAQM